MDEKKLTKKQIETVVTEFIDSIDYAIDFTIEPSEDESIYNVYMTGENLGALIGFHGKNIGSIEHIINLMLLRKYETTQRIRLDVNEYRKGRLEQLKSYTEKAVQQVEQTKQSYDLSPMTPYERLCIHEYIKTFKNITSESFGVEPNRYIKITYEE
jgi:spoIIIJ-associated protein